MAILEAQNLEAILKQASGSISDPRDKETAERLIASLSAATSKDDIDHKRIATVLAKAGRIEDCHKVVAGIEKRWERADALCSAARGLLDATQKEKAGKLLDEAAKEASTAQSEGSDMEQLSACSVLADIVEMYAELSNFKKADKLAASMTDPIRRDRAVEKLESMRPAAKPKKPRASKSSKKQV